MQKLQQHAIDSMGMSHVKLKELQSEMLARNETSYATGKGAASQFRRVDYSWNNDEGPVGHGDGKLGVTIVFLGG